MAIGKLSRSYKKVPEATRELAFTNIAFAHEFLLEGESVINYSDLNAPSEWLSSGRVNPSPSELLAANLRFFKNQIVLTSSVKGIIQPSQYEVTSTSIVFKTFTSEAGESFEVQVMGATFTGKTLVDGVSLKSSGELNIGSSEFNFGRAVKIEPEEIMVFKNGQLKKRNPANSPTLVSEGDYYFLDPLNTGYSSVVKFNNASTVLEEVTVVSIGSFIEKPTISMLQEIEKVAGQVDALIPFVADLAGVPETTFQTAPNNVDLLQFGTNVKSGLSQVGDFVFSPALTVAQFQKLRGDSWVPVDGASIAGSLLATLTSYTILPVMPGWYVKIND